MDRLPFIGGSGPVTQWVRYASGVTQTAGGVNRSRGADELIVYTPQYDSDTNTDNSGTEVLVEMTRPTLVLVASDRARGHIREIRQNQGSTPIPFDHVVLSATGTAATSLLANVNLGDEISLAQNYANPGWWTKGYASVSGGEVFLSGGIVVGGQTVKHPRTAAAYNEDHVFFVVVDGRSTQSVGMNMTELGNFCKDYLDADTGINLDGGGSSTMVVNGSVVNDPSDGNERSVSNSIMMVSLQPKLQSTAFNSGDTVEVTTPSNLRLGPGTNYTSLTNISPNTEGIIVDHSLRGIYAKGNYWWKCNFNGTVGWIFEGGLTLVSAGNLPTITQHPADINNICPGDTAVFSVSAAGTGALGYQWQKHGADLSDDGHHTGTASTTLNIHDVGQNDLGSYRCLITDDNGTTTSWSTALIRIDAPTTISQHPQSQDLRPIPHGQDVGFNINATGEGMVAFQWLKGDVELTDDGHTTGVTTPTLTIHHVTGEDSGSYRCRVSAECGIVDSEVASLLVATPDFDGDGDVDLADFGHMQACLSGPSVPQLDPLCQDALFDLDGDVDDADFTLFRSCISGINVPMVPHCQD
jgi:hypothetical protein